MAFDSFRHSLSAFIHSTPSWELSSRPTRAQDAPIGMRSDSESPSDAHPRRRRRFPSERIDDGFMSSATRCPPLGDLSTASTTQHPGKKPRRGSGGASPSPWSVRMTNASRRAKPRPRWPPCRPIRLSVWNEYYRRRQLCELQSRSDERARSGRTAGSVATRKKIRRPQRPPSSATPSALIVCVNTLVLGFPNREPRIASRGPVS